MLVIIIAGLFLLLPGDGGGDSMTVPLGGTSASLDTATEKLGRPLVVPAYVPPGAVYGPQFAIHGAGSKDTSSAVMSFYGSEKKVVLQVTQSPPVSHQIPAGRTIVTVGNVDIALLLDADRAHFKDGTFATHAYAEFTTAGNSFVVELFAPTDTETEAMTAELLAVSTSMFR